jgi:hypothetical protein
MPKEFTLKIDRDIDRQPQERIKLVEKYLESLSEKLKDESELLRDDGIPVNYDCRIDLDQLVNRHQKYTQEFVSKIKNNTATLEAQFEKARVSDPKKKESKEIGELLEIVKTLMFNQDLFRGRFKTIRTSNVDDINNGVDELIFDEKTGFPIGVIDVTAGIGSKEHNLEIRMKIGGRLDFGLEIIKKDGQADRFIPKPIQELPLYVFEMRLEDILKIANAKTTGNYDEDAKKILKSTEENTLRKFIENGNIILANKTLNETMRAKYREANSIFEDILKSI